MNIEDNTINIGGKTLQQKFKKKLNSDIWTAAIFLFPAFFFIISFTLFPALYSIYLSFTNSTLFSTSYNFVGLKNYLRLFQDPEFINSAKTTILIVFPTVFLQFFLGLFLAFLLNRSIWGRLFYRTSLLIPWVFSEIIVVATWRYILNSNFGMLNYYLNLLGFPKITWLSSPTFAVVSVIMLCVWRGTAFSMVIQLSGLQTIPDELYEAAEIDGSNGWQKIIFVTLPQLRTIIATNIILITMWTFNLFSLVYALTGGGPINATQIVGVFMYKTAFEFFDVSYASSLSGIMFVLNLVIVIIYMKIFKLGSE